MITDPWTHDTYEALDLIALDEFVQRLAKDDPHGGLDFFNRHTGSSEVEQLARLACATYSPTNALTPRQ